MLFDLILLKIEDFMKYFLLKIFLTLFHDRLTCEHYCGLEVLSLRKTLVEKTPKDPDVMWYRFETKSHLSLPRGYTTEILFFKRS